MIATAIATKAPIALNPGDVVAAQDAYTLALVIGHDWSRSRGLTLAVLVECAGGRVTHVEYGDDDRVAVFSTEDFIDWEVLHGAA